MKQQEKKAIVIGASSGIGLEVARLLIKEGWTVGVAARRVELMQGIGVGFTRMVGEAFRYFAQQGGGHIAPTVLYGTKKGPSLS